MKRAVTALFLVLVIVSGAALAAPRILVETAWRDFGTVPLGSALTHAFLLTNVGDASLVLSLATECSCTEATFEKSTLGPGESGALVVNYLVTGVGRERKSVVVRSNDPATPRLTLYVGATGSEHLVAPTSLAPRIRVLVDLRAPEAYAAGHLLGALSLPYTEMPDGITFLPRDAAVVLYDEEGAVLDAVSAALLAAGLTRLELLQGGLRGWIAQVGSELLAAGLASDERVIAPVTLPASGAPSAASALDPLALRKSFLVLVDLRRPEEYELVHLAGAVNVAPDRLSSWVASLPQDVEIVLYDGTGEALSTVQALREQGFTRARALFGGLARWRTELGDQLLVTSPTP